MLVTALNPVIGYDMASKVAKNAHKKGITLKESAMELKAVSEVDFEKYVDHALMLSPKPKKLFFFSRVSCSMVFEDVN